MLRAQLEFNEALRADATNEKKIGEAQKRLAEAQKALTQAPEGYNTIGKVYENKSTGRRTALAQLDCFADKPSYGASGDEPHVAAPFREAAGAYSVRFRPERQTSIKSATARLACHGVHEQRLEHEEDASA